jgi:hypothetical protein
VKLPPCVQAAEISCARQFVHCMAWSMPWCGTMSNGVVLYQQAAVRVLLSSPMSVTGVRMPVVSLLLHNCCHNTQYVISGVCHPSPQRYLYGSSSQSICVAFTHL